jgi:hypothetical protein
MDENHKMDDNYKLMNNLDEKFDRFKCIDGIKQTLQLNNIKIKNQQNILCSSYLKLFHYNLSNYTKIIIPIQNIFKQDSL